MANTFPCVYVAGLADGQQPCQLLATVPELEGATVSTLPVGDAEQAGGVDEDYPYACAAGFFGGSSIEAQTSMRCSGVCPAGFSCPSGTVTPLPCEAGGFCAVGSSVATSCGSGSFSMATNLTSYSQCSPCTPGHWCTQGSRVRCGRNTYNERFGAFDQRSCLLCPINSHTAAEAATHASACICDVSYVKITTSNASARCDPCPEGGLCNEPGTTLENLTVQSGYWRTSTNTTLLIRCPDAAFGNSACQGGTGAPCKPALTGAYCRVCIDDWAYYDERASDCKSCALLPPETTLLMGLALLLVLALLIQCARLMRARRRERERRAALAFAAAASTVQVRDAHRTRALQALRDRESEQHRLTNLQTQRGRLSRCSLGLNTWRGGTDEGRESGANFADKPSRRQRISQHMGESFSQRENSRAQTTASARLVNRLRSLLIRAGVSCKLRLLVSFLQVVYSASSKQRARLRQIDSTCRGLTGASLLVSPLLQVICSLDAVYLLSWPRELVTFLRQLQVSRTSVVTSVVGGMAVATKIISLCDAADASRSW